MFVEDVNKRAKKAKNFTDDADPTKHACVGTIAPLHYESVNDSGVFDAEIDLTARNISISGYRGLNVTHNGFHYRYGRLNNQPGWTGFGGRQGEHWFYFKATGMGFMQSRHAGWTAIGSPDYRSVNESHTVGTTELIQGVEVKNSLEVIQQDVWPGVDITWRVSGDSLKEQIEINSTAWADVKQRAASMNSAFRFGFSFDLDVRDIPKMRDVNTQRLFTITEGFDGDSTDKFELLNDNDELLAFLPIDKAWVEDAEGNVIEGSERMLFKEFYRYSNRNHLYVGLSVDDLLSMPDGHKVVFDPTVDTQVGTTANDGYGNAGVFSTTSHTLFTGYSDPPGVENIAFALFTGITIEGTIDTSYTSWWSYTSADTTGYDVNVAAEDTDNPSAPTTWTDLNGRTLTTAKANWTKTTGWASAGFENTPSLNGSLQELVDTYTISSDNVLILIANNSGTGLKQFREYTNNSARAPKLYVEYSTGGGSTLSATAIDGIDLSETLARRADFSATVTDGVNFSEANANIATLLAIASDGIDFSETVLAGLLIQALSTDQVVLAEVLDGVVALIGLAQDGLTLSEAIATTMYAQGVVTDGLEMSDTSLASISFDAVALDGFTLSETLGVTSLLLALAEDGVVFSDSLTGDLPGFLDAIVTEGITLGDYAASQSYWFVDAVDGFNLGDIPIGDILAIGLEGTVLDGIVLSDTGDVNATFYVTVSDQATMADTIATLMAYGVVVTDGFTIGDTAVHLLPTGELSVTFSTKTVRVTFVAKTPSTRTNPLN